MWIVQDNGSKDVNSQEGVRGKATFAKLNSEEGLKGGSTDAVGSCEGSWEQWWEEWISSHWTKSLYSRHCQADQKDFLQAVLTLSEVYIYELKSVDLIFL